MGLGWLIHRDGNSDLAIEYFLKAISLDPNFALTSEFKALLAKKRFGWQIYNKFGWAYYEKNDQKNQNRRIRYFFHIFKVSINFATKAITNYKAY